ncbi:MAG: HlyD family secretion protein, partial [Terriglobia bacterium]
NVNVALVKQYDSELQGIQSRIALAKQLRASKLAQLESEHHDLKSEYQSLGTQLQTEQAISALTKKNLARYRKLVHSGMVSKSDFQQVQQKMLTQKEGVEEIKKTRIELRTQLDQIPAQLAQAKTDAANEIASLRNQAVQLAQERLQLQVAQQVVVRAPAAGTVSSVMARLGENVVPQTPLVSILPHGSVLEARLLVPTAAIGFVHAGESVRLSYSAFPYEQFGLYHGTVRQVSRSIITPGELDLPVNPHAPYYLIIASLAEPYVRAYGRNLPMTAGMTLSADIVLDREPSTPARTGVIAPPVKRTKL